MITLRNVRPEDLEDLLRIENEAFLKKEAATKEAFRRKDSNDSRYVYCCGKEWGNCRVY